MSYRRWIHVLLTCVLGMIVLTGCVAIKSPDSQLYTLSSSGNAAAAVQEQSGASLPVLAVGPVNLPDYLRRPQLVSREGANRIKVAEFDRWAAPLNEQVERVLAENLEARVQGMVVVNYREQRFKPTYRLTMTLERFERRDGDQVDLAGRWTLTNAQSGAVLLTRRGSFAVPIQGDGYEASVAAQSRALARLADDVSAEMQKVISDDRDSR